MWKPYTLYDDDASDEDPQRKHKHKHMHSQMKPDPLADTVWIVSTSIDWAMYRNKAKRDKKLSADFYYRK